MSSVDLDGSHTQTLCGGEEVGYKGHKKRKTTNTMYLTYRWEIPPAMSSPESEKHHDIENVIGNMLEDL